MSRFDKYEPRVGGFRAKLEAALTGTPAGHPLGETGDVGVLRAVSLNASGRVVIGTAAQSGFVGVICPVRPMAAGETIDVMTSGEIGDFTETDETASTAGTNYYAATDGQVTTAGSSTPYVGTTVEVGRLVVRANALPVTAA